MYENLKFSLTEDGELQIDILSDDESDIIDTYVFSEDLAHQLFLFLKKHFRSVRKTTKVF